MALKKTIDYKGITAEYWRIISKTIDLFNNKSHCTLGLYLNNTSRRNNVRNVLDRREFLFDGDLTTAQLYLAIKEPKLETIVVQEFVPAVKDDDGNIIISEVPLIEETIETNWFNDAEDV